MGEIESQIRARVACKFRLAVPTVGQLDAHRRCSQIQGTDRAQRSMGGGEQAAISVKFKSRRTSLLVLRQKSRAQSDIGVILEGSNPPNMDFVRAERKISGSSPPNSSREIRIVFLDFRAQSSRTVAKLCVEGYSSASLRITRDCVVTRCR